jgi:ribosomal-protein-alanine N-acetyltransferase
MNVIVKAGRREVRLLSFFARSTILVEPLSSDFSDACSNIHRDCFAHPWSSYDLEAMIASSAFVADGAIDASSRKLLGFILTRCVKDEAEVMTIAVLSSSRRKGIAGLLLRQHLDRLSSFRVVKVFLEVAEDNHPARSLYSGFGFKLVGARNGYYRVVDGTESNALVLAKELF